MASGTSGAPSHNQSIKTMMMDPSTNGSDDATPNDAARELPHPAVATVIIAGGGIAGLVLALALHRHCSGLVAEVYESAAKFERVGGAIGMYPNGLRVIRDISPELLGWIRHEGYPHVWRRWYRHTGHEIARSREGALAPSGRDSDELAPLGILRWRLQRALFEACAERGIPVRFGKRARSVVRLEDGTVEVGFADGTARRAALAFGADGANSLLRNAVVGGGGHCGGETMRPDFAGVTCVLGTAPVHRPMRGICRISSLTTGCHMSTFPTGEGDTVFEVYFPTKGEGPRGWRRQSDEMAKMKCEELADRMERDGWNPQFVRPIRKANPDSVMLVGLQTFTGPPLSKWAEGPVALLGDAAHPYLPYLGQGGQMAIEDAGTLALLLKHFCCGEGVTSNSGSGRVSFSQPLGHAPAVWNRQSKGDCGFSAENAEKAFELYQKIRVPRKKEIHDLTMALGRAQQKRADSKAYSLWREWIIKVGVWWYGTLPIMLPGATYNYSADVEKVLKEEAGLHRRCRC